MKKIIVMFLLCLVFVGCSSETVSEADLNTFITDYKTALYNGDDVKSFVEEELYNKSEKNGIYAFPQRFAKENGITVQLTDIQLDAVEEDKDNYTIRYTLFLIIDDEQYEKPGTLTIAKNDPLIITADHETPIMVGNLKFI